MVADGEAHVKVRALPVGTEVLAFRGEILERTESMGVGLLYRLKRPVKALERGEAVVMARLS
jgi:hypothetical protein